MFQRIFLTFLCQRFYHADVLRNFATAVQKHHIIHTFRKRHTTGNVNV